MLKKRLICFCGIDGSGKTSHAKDLHLELRKRSIKTKIINIRGAVAFEPFIGFLGKLKIVSIKSNIQKPFRFYYLKCNGPLQLIWEILILSFFLVSSLVRVCIPLILGYTIICDRYVYDILVDLIVVTENWSLLSKSTLARISLKSSWVNKGITIMLETDKFEAIKRKRDITDVNYYSIRQSLYRQFSRQFSIPVVDSGRSFSEVRNKIRTIIEM
jgi:thymidylate kinase